MAHQSEVILKAAVAIPPAGLTAQNDLVRDDDGNPGIAKPTKD